MHPGLAAEAREELISRLSSCLASSLDLMLQAKTAHWNLIGREFIALHELFDRVAKHLRHQSDRIAERAVALGGHAAGTARHVAARSVISEYPADAREALDHVRALVERLAAYALELRATMAFASEPDPATEHLIADSVEDVERDIWFLSSHLGEATAEAERRKRAA